MDTLMEPLSLPGSYTVKSRERRALLNERRRKGQWGGLRDSIVDIGTRRETPKPYTAVFGLGFRV